jgi:hypothetical protein
MQTCDAIIYIYVLLYTCVVYFPHFVDYGRPSHEVRFLLNGLG